MSEFSAVLKPAYDDGVFCIGPTHGFLPSKEPLHKLPEKYACINDVCSRLHVNQPDGILGVANKIVAEVDALPNLVEDVEQESDPMVQQALFRAYSFLTSAFTLETSYQECLKTGNYGEARRILPRQVAQPFVAVANKLNVFPFIDYHYSYSLGNYVKKDPNGTLDWKNLDMAIKFAGTDDEIGFIMLHVYINEVSPALLQSIHHVQDALRTGDTDLLLRGMELNFDTIKEMNRRRQEMWKASNPKRYNDFRVFIMGVKGNEELFGPGIVYQGCFNDEPRAFRGQTGAQDDIIPTQDIFTGLTEYYPQNKLTEYLVDLRQYRPRCVQTFFDDLRAAFGGKALLKHLSQLPVEGAEDSAATAAHRAEALVWLWRIVDEIYRFRNGHWQFVQQYIMANTRYEKATGGTPITSWLINQIEACLQYQTEIAAAISNTLPAASSTGGASSGFMSSSGRADVEAAYADLSDTLPEKKALLCKQVAHLNEVAQGYDIELIYNWNKEHHLCDDPAEA